MIQRHSLEFSISAAAAKTDTGKLPVVGSVDQVWWVPNGGTQPDTGAAPVGTIEVFLVPPGATDTGLMAIAYNSGAVALGNDHLGSADTGVIDPLVSAGDCYLKARVSPATGDTGTISGKLHVYTGARG